VKTRKIRGRIFVSLCLLILVFDTFSCSLYSTNKPDPTPIWKFEPEAIHIRYRADESLNFFSNNPHTLVLIVFQLSGIDTFNDYAKNEDGLKKLLYVGSVDPTVVRTDKFIVQPGERKTIILDRGENVKWVGIVAGYYELMPGLVNQTFQIPVVIEIIGKIRKKKIAKIEHLSISLFFGSHVIRKDGDY